jgi:hypothetical protein
MLASASSPLAFSAASERCKALVQSDLQHPSAATDLAAQGAGGRDALVARIRHALVRATRILNEQSVCGQGGVCETHVSERMLVVLLLQLNSSAGSPLRQQCTTQLRQTHNKKNTLVHAPTPIGARDSASIVTNC